MKIYVKPSFGYVELSSQEKHAKPSGHVDCSACQGASSCMPGGLPGGGQ